MEEFAIHCLGHVPGSGERSLQPLSVVTFGVIGQKTRAAEFREEHQLRTVGGSLAAIGQHGIEIGGNVFGPGVGGYGRDGSLLVHGCIHSIRSDRIRGDIAR